MRWMVAVLVLAAVGCSRRESPPGPAAGGSAEVPPVAPTAATAPALTPLGVCNRLRATTGHVSDCAPSDAGNSASFRVDTNGVGLVHIARSQAEYDRIMNGLGAKGMQMATSDEKHVIVLWTSTGSEGSDFLIRSVVTTL